MPERSNSTSNSILPSLCPAATRCQAPLMLGGREAARKPFEKIASDLTPYGFLRIFPQDEQRHLTQRLHDFGVQVSGRPNFSDMPRKAAISAPGSWPEAEKVW